MGTEMVQVIAMHGSALNSHLLRLESLRTDSEKETYLQAVS